MFCIQLSLKFNIDFEKMNLYKVDIYIYIFIFEFKIFQIFEAIMCMIKILPFIFKNILETPCKIYKCYEL